MSEPAGGKLLWIVFLAAWLLRLAFSVEYEHRHPLADRPVIDEAAYERWALEVAGGDWLGDEVFFQEPLYPYALGLVYGLADRAEQGRATQRQRTAARHGQAFLGALVVLLVFRLTALPFGTRAAAVAAIAAATYRPLLLLPSYLLKPNLFLPLFAWLAWSLVRSRLPRSVSPRRLGPWLAIGLAVGAGALLRGNVVMLAPLFVLWPWTRRLAPRAAERGASASWPAVAVALGIALVLLPVAVRNHAVGGVFALTTSGAGTNLYGGNNPGNPQGRATELDFVRGIPEFEADDWRREAERRLASERGAGEPVSLDPGEVSAYWLAETLRSVRERPLVHARILWNKLRLALGAYEVPDNRSLEWDARHLFLARLPFPGFALWGWLGLAGLLLFLLGPGRAPARSGQDGWDRRAAAELAALFVAYLATIVLTVVSMRVRLALVPLLLPFAGFLVDRAVAAVSATAGLRDVLAPLLALALAAVPVFVPLVDREGRAEDLAERDFNLATYLLEEADGLDRAQALAADLARRYAGTPRLENLRAELDARRAFLLHHAEEPAGPERAARIGLLRRDALARLRAVVEDERTGARERFRAHSIAAFVQLDAGNEGAAERHLRRARAFDPDDRRLRLWLANALYLQAIDGEAEDRAAALAEAEELLVGLARDARDAELAERLEAVREAARR